MLDGVSSALPAAQRAVKLQDKAAKVGFDWPEIGAVLEKAEEEIAELKEAVASGDDEHVAEELGDLLFVLANVARWKGLDPDQVLRAANAKFEKRFKAVEAMLQARGKSPATAISPRWTRSGARRRRLSRLPSPAGEGGPRSGSDEGEARSQWFTLISQAPPASFSTNLGLARDWHSSCPDRASPIWCGEKQKERVIPPARARASSCRTTASPRRR